MSIELCGGRLSFDEHVSAGVGNRTAYRRHVFSSYFIGKTVNPTGCVFPDYFIAARPIDYLSCILKELDLLGLGLLESETNSRNPRENDEDDGQRKNTNTSGTTLVQMLCVLRHWAGS
ncbi:hypothetical protein [Pseudarthrobacter sp. NCCP-2145]|uniref:hypothetical protein n=1 Tax=Pseudarthrobacter sp. NCCP-2145 TaxID=2942290 RepID=UPI00203C6300|nr:hypothetical protein [Pseudarthrobacter sp. NCCP-2145]GKV74493.1 hypothetical protein NCCP2145_38740 [Pseudarthrobacter sp. NCCP-2145]